MPAFQSVLHMHLEKGGSPARTHCLFRFFIRLFGITAHLSAPILLAGAILTTVISSISLSTATQNNDARNTSPVATSYYNGPSPYGGMRTRNYSPSYMDSLPNTGKTPEAFGLVTILSIVFLCFPVITYFGVCVLSLIPYILDSFKKCQRGKERSRITTTMNCRKANHVKLDKTY